MTKLHFQRFEIKYQMPLNMAEGLMPEFLKYMDFDPYAKDLPQHAYQVASLYYDSAGLDCYYQKLAGLKTRKKLRIRFYNFDLEHESQVFLEIKRKYDAVIIKDRLALNYKNCYALLKQNQPLNLSFTPAEQATLNEFLWLKNYNSLLPQNMVVYQRRPLISKVDPNFRLTLDYNLQTYPADWLDAESNSRLVNTGMVILEVKFNNILPFWFHQIIQRYNLEHRPFSKYCNCLEMCYPELAAKSWVEVYNNTNSSLSAVRG